MRYGALVPVVALLCAACGGVTEADNGFLGARTDGFVWTATTVDVRRSGGLITLDASEDADMTGISITVPESTGLHQVESGSPVVLSYTVPGVAWTASDAAGGSASVNITALSSEGVVGTFTGVVQAQDGQARTTVTISQGAFDIRF